MAQIVPITDIETLKAAGIHYPRSVWGWRWAYRRREENGLEKAFIKLNGRICVNVPAYLECINRSR